MMGANLSLPGFDPDTGLLMLPWWAAAALAAFLVVALVMAMLRGGVVIVVGGVVGIAFLALVVTVAWFGNTRMAQREHAEERHALLTRAQGLAATAAMPGSALGCLDAMAGDSVEAACERALFATPESVASAAAYTAARIALLSDGLDYALAANTSYEGALPGLRAALESDRFGFVAQVLTSRYGCSPDNCDAFTLFRNTARIATNLKERTYDTYVTRYAASWQARPNRSPLASMSGASPVPPGFNVPSAASIPPVSIMVPEPEPTSTSSTSAAPAEASASASAPPTPARRAAPAAARSARPAHPAPPVQIVPPIPTAPPQPNTGSAAGSQ
jgi:hypothetical protein